MSGDINAGFLREPVGLCSSSFLSDVSVPRSLCPYSPSPSPPSSPLHSPQSVRHLSLAYTPPSPSSVRSHSPVTSTQLEAGDIRSRSRGHGRGRGRSSSIHLLVPPLPLLGNMVGAKEVVESGDLGEVGAHLLLLLFLNVHIVYLTLLLSQLILKGPHLVYGDLRNALHTHISHSFLMTNSFNT